jgi:hypothetical protein
MVSFTGIAARSENLEHRDNPAFNASFFAPRFNTFRRLYA